MSGPRHDSVALFQKRQREFDFSIFS